MFFDVVSISSKRVENTYQSLKLHVSGQAEDGGIVVACVQLTSRQSFKQMCKNGILGN